MTGAIWLISKVKRGTAFAAVFGWSAVVVLARVALPQRLPDASQKLAMHTSDDRPIGGGIVGPALPTG